MIERQTTESSQANESMAAQTDNQGDASLGEALTALHQDIRQQLDSPACDEKAAKRIRRQWQVLQADPAADEAAQPLKASIEAALDELREKLHREIEQREKAFQEVGDLTDRLEAELESGQLSDASANLDTINKKLAAIDGLSDRRKETIEKRLQAVQPQLSQLRDWRKWGTTQAREQLIASMDQLDGQEQHPKVIAQEVQKARDTWKSWDKSGDPVDKTLWQRFDAACTKAYAPCKAYFEKLAAERQHNLQLREALIEKLKTLLAATDWDTPDWRRLDKSIRDSEQQWKRLGPVDGRHKKRIDQAFKAITEEFAMPLGAERNRNLKMRRDLISTVVAAKEESDTRKAIDIAKKAQQAWKPTVLASPKQERDIWREFRSACDAIFVRRDTERKAQDAEFAEGVKQRETVCEQLEALLTKVQSGASDAIDESKKESVKLKQTWQDLKPIPYKLAASTEQRFQKVRIELEQAHDQHRNSAAERRLEQYKTCADICESLEAALLDGNDAGSWQTAVVRATADWEAANAGSGNLAASLAARWEQVRKAVDDAGARDELAKAADASLERRRDICLRLEVVAEIDSPAAFSRERMALQVGRLAAAMGGRKQPTSGSQGNDDDPESLRDQYWATSTVLREHRDELNRRFSLAHQAIIEQQREQLARAAEKKRQAAQRKAAKSSAAPEKRAGSRPGGGRRGGPRNRPSGEQRRGASKS